MPRILIVEDDRDIALGLEEDLARHGYEVATVGDGEKAVRSGKEDAWDLILLDLMLPRKDGFEVCQQLRLAGVKTPIIMLTAKTHEAEKVLGLELGADDYVTKPFSPRELRARIHAILRRVAEESRGTHRFGDCEVDFDRGEVRRAGAPIDVSALEFRLLAAFIRQRGRVLSRDQLIDAAWGHGTFVTDRVVDTHVLNLRKKIEPVPAKPCYIRSVRGMGYRFDG
jgi:two-component system alkaline phosphatase synthesis response regulator PhoP